MNSIEQPTEPAMSAKELTRMLIQKAAAKNGGKLGTKKGDERYDVRKFRRL